MSESSTPESSPTSTATRDFFLILICAIGLSIAFVQWMKTSVNTKVPGGLAVGEPAPEIRASHWVNGTAPEAAELDGKVYVVVAWATWCYPCYQEAPHLLEVYEKVHDKGVEFIGLTAQQESLQPEIEKWLSETNIPWRNGFGNDAVQTLLEYEADFIPAVWVIGKDGKVAWNRSLQHEESLEEAIERALSK